MRYRCIAAFTGVYTPFDLSGKSDSSYPDSFTNWYAKMFAGFLLPIFSDMLASSAMRCIAAFTGVCIPFDLSGESDSSCPDSVSLTNFFSGFDSPFFSDMFAFSVMPSSEIPYTRCMLFVRH